MSKESTTLQIRLPDELRTRVTRIAEVNHLSEADVVRLVLGQTLPGIEKNGLTILPSGKKDEEEAGAAAA
jgi:hypothetical protein